MADVVPQPCMPENEDPYSAEEGEIVESGGGGVERLVPHLIALKARSLLCRQVHIQRYAWSTQGLLWYHKTVLMRP